MKEDKEQISADSEAEALFVQAIVANVDAGA